MEARLEWLEGKIEYEKVEAATVDKMFCLQRSREVMQ